MEIKYKAGTFKNKPMLWMQLPDKTILYIWDKTITIGYPKRKFKKGFESVLRHIKEKHFLATWSFDELYGILEVLRKLEPELKKLDKNKGVLKEK